MFRDIGIGGKYQEYGPGIIDGVDDGLTPIASGQDVSGSDPTAHAIGFQKGADLVGSELVFTGVANKNIMWGHCQ